MLNIPVYHALLVGIIERQGAAVENADQPLEREEFVNVAEIGQGLAAGNVFHHDVMGIAFYAGIEDRGNIRVHQHSGGSSLVKKKLLKNLAGFRAR